jgi:hypothetical protein
VKRTRFIAHALVPILFALAVGCGGNTPPRPAPQLPPVLENVEGDVRQAAREALGILRSSAVLNDRTADTYLETFRAAKANNTPIPEATDKRIRDAHVAVSDKIIAGVKKIQEGLRSWDELRAILQPIVGAVNDLSNTVTQVANSFSSGGWRGAVATLIQVIGNLQTIKGAEEIALDWPDAFELAAGGAR